MKLIRTVALVGALLLSAEIAAAQSSLTNGLVAYWSFEDAPTGTNVMDSVGGFNGALSTNGVTFESGGLSGQALRFNASSNGYVNMGDVLSFPNGNFSLVAWIKMDPGDNVDNRVVMSRHDAGTRNGYFLVVNTSTNVLTPNVAHFVIGGTGTAAQTDPETPSSTTEVNQDGNWHLLVATHSTITGEAIYVDGGPAEDTAPNLAHLTVNGIDFLLGGFVSSGNPTGVFNGLMDEVRVYNRALLPSEVNAIYQSQTPKPSVPIRVSTWAGPADPGETNTTGFVDGFRLDARFHSPSFLRYDRQDQILVTDSSITGFQTAQVGSHAVRRFDTNGFVTTVAGSTNFAYVDGPGDQARFQGASGIVVNSSNITFVADRQNSRIRRIDASNVVNTVSAGFTFATPVGLEIDRNDNIYVGEFDGFRITRIAPDETVTVFAGDGTRGYRDGPAATARFNGIHDIAFGPQGDLYVADWNNNCVRRIDTNGVVSTFATGLTFVQTVTVDAEGSVYATTGQNVKLHKFDANGTLLWSIDGSGGFQDGPINVAKFDNFGKPFFLKTNNNFLVSTADGRIRLVEVGSPDLFNPANLNPGTTIPLLSETVVRFAPKTGTGFPWLFKGTNELEVVPGTGDLVSTQSFNGFRLHAEFMTPTNGQNGNSGIFLQGRYEVQIFNSFGVATTNLGGNDCGAIWGQTPPATNACLAPGQWQTYDIEFQPAQWNGTNKVVDARVTVVLNGVIVQNDVAIPGPTQAGAAELRSPGPVLLQDNGSAVRFRNVSITPFDIPPPVEWVRTAGQTSETFSTDLAEASAIDRNGNVFVAGVFGGTARFGTNTVTSLGAHDVFLAKYSPAGDLLWVASGGSTGGDTIGDVAVDNAGNPVITGSLAGPALFGSLSLTNGGGEDFFIAKFDGAGNVLWGLSAGGALADRGTGISADQAGSIFVSGNISNGGRLGSFMIKLAPDGTLIWSRSAAGLVGDTEALDIVADEAGGAYVVGETVGDAQFGNINVASTGSQEAYLLHIDAAGVVQWVNRSSGFGSELATSIARGPDGHLYIEGWSTGNATFGNHQMSNQGGFDSFVIKATPGGSVVWLRQLVNTPVGARQSIAVDAAGDVYVTANFATNASVSSIDLTGSGPSDGLFAKFSTDGTQVWAQSIGAAGNDIVTHVATDPFGRPHLVGSFEQVLQLGSHVVSSAGAGDLFVARLDAFVELPSSTHWRFDDPSIPLVTADVAGSFPGILSVTGAVFTTDAFSTNALRLHHDTNGFVDFGNLQIDIFQPVTIAMMVRTLGGDTNHFILLSDHNLNTGRGFLLGLNGLGTNHHPGSVYFTPTGDLQDGIIATSPVNDGRWHSLIVTHEPFRGARLYIDGQPAGATGPMSLVREGGRLVAGGAVAAGRPYGDFDGWLDELVIHNRVLSPDEIVQQALYPETPAQPAPIRAEFRWVETINATGGSTANGIVEDGNGNTFVTGSFTGTATIGTNVFVSRGSTDIFLAKYNADGQVVWARQAGGTFQDSGEDIAVDRDGNVIICGAASSLGFGSQRTIFFDGQTLLLTGTFRGFLAKYSPDGQIQLARELWGPANGVDTDSARNIYVGGNLQENRVDLHTIELQLRNGTDVWSARFSSVGNAIWAYSYGGSGVSRSAGLRLADDNAYYAAGTFTASMLINGNFLFAPNNAQSAFLMRHSTLDGSVAWARQSTNTSLVTVNSLFTENGSAHLSGQHVGTVSFGGNTLGSVGTNILGGYAAAYNSLGLGQSAFQLGNNVATSLRQRPNSLYLAGDLTGSTTIDGNLYQSAGLSDTLIVRRDAAGTNRLVKHVSGTAGINPTDNRGLATDRFGNVFVAGQITISNPGFDVARFDNLVVAPTNQQSAFVAKMNSEVTIVRQPSDLLATNLNASFLRVLADSPTPVAYQWYFNGTNAIPGGVGPRLNLDDTQLLQSGDYHVVVSNDLGYAVSRPARVVVELPPVFINQPTNSAAQSNLTAIIHSTVAGNPPIALQWHHNGSPVAGQTNETLTIANVMPAQAGLYQIFATNQFGVTASLPVTLTVLQPGRLPEITTQPAPVTSALGAPAAFSVTVTGEEPIFYQWYKNGVAIPNRIDALLTFGSVQSTDAASYHVIVTNLLGSVTSSNATLSVFTPTPVSITAQPQGTNILAGQDIVLSVTATGSPLIRYQWLRNATVLVNATNSTLFINGAGIGDSGKYTVQVNNDFSGTVSSEATVNVQQAPVFTLQPQSVVVTNTQFTNFQATVTGLPTPALQWFKDGVALTNNIGFFGVDTPTLTISAASPAHVGTYYLRATNSAGETLSTPALLGMNFPPQILSQPVSATLVLGTNHTFSLSVTGAPPIFLRWFKDGLPLPAGTNATLALTNVSRLHSGVYQLTATNQNGGTVSSNATIHVLVPQRLGEVQLNNGMIEFLLGDADGSNFVSTNLPLLQVQLSSNLVNWVTDTNSLIYTNGQLLYRDSSVTLPSHRYYRVIEP